MERQARADAVLETDPLLDEKAKREAAIGFVLNEAGAHSVLISFRNFTDLENYIPLSGSRLTAANRLLIKSLQETCGHLYCRHACGICESKCPVQVPVNTIMRYNHYFMAQGMEKFAMEKYNNLPGGKPHNCMDCEGFCESACPYGVPIRSLLPLAHHNLSLHSGHQASFPS
jgi:predicted aldo/keto reductase-like oxidoreductase